MAGGWELGPCEEKQEELEGRRGARTEEEGGGIARLSAKTLGPDEESRSMLMLSHRQVNNECSVGTMEELEHTCPQLWTVRSYFLSFSRVMMEKAIVEVRGKLYVIRQQFCE